MRQIYNGLSTVVPTKHTAQHLKAEKGWKITFENGRCVQSGVFEGSGPRPVLELVGCSHCSG